MREHTHVRRRAEPRDSDPLTFKLLRGFDIGPDHQPVVEQLLHAHEHDWIASLQTNWRHGALVIWPNWISPDIKDGAEMLPGR